MATSCLARSLPVVLNSKNARHTSHRRLTTCALGTVRAGSWQPSFSFAAQGAVSSEKPEEQVAVNQGNHLYAQKMHIRRRRDKPAKNRNAWKRAEKKAMLMRVGD